MWRDQNYSTSKDSVLNLSTYESTFNLLAFQFSFYFSFFFMKKDKMRGQSYCRQTDCWKPPYVGRCLGECDVILCVIVFVKSLWSLKINLSTQISQSKYRYPLSAVRPDYVTSYRETTQSKLPSAPDLPYSKHTPPHWMGLNDPQKYFKTGIACLCNCLGASAINLRLSIKQIWLLPLQPFCYFRASTFIIFFFYFFQKFQCCRLEKVFWLVVPLISIAPF